MSRSLQILSSILLLAGMASAQARKPSRAALGRMNLERLNRMPAEDRQRLLEKLPPERKAVVEKRLQHYNSLPPETKERLHQEYEYFQQLPPEKQMRVRELFRSFKDLPEDRRGPVRGAYQRLRALPPDERKRRLESEQFRSRFSPSEYELLRNLSGLLSPVPAATRTESQH